VVYFKRALKLNRRFLSAWTLMGHEFIELKNTQAAIEVRRWQAAARRAPRTPLTSLCVTGLSQRRRH
jgi:hypothetical protein